MIRELPNGKHEVSWPIATVRTGDGHFVTGRPETVGALTGKKPATLISEGVAVKIGTLEECQFQED